MVFDFLKGLGSFWDRQKRNWRVLVTRQIFNRFVNQITMQFSNIYTMALGASPVELGWVSSASGLVGTLISVPVGWLQDRYSLKKVFLLGVTLSTFIPPLLRPISPLVDDHTRHRPSYHRHEAGNLRRDL
jgi:MFS family permease